MTPDEPRRDVTAPRDPEVPPPPDHDCLVSTTGTGNRPIDSAASLTTPTSGHGDQDGECHVRFRFDSVARNDVTSSSCTLPKEPHPVRDQTVYRRAPPPRVEAAPRVKAAEGRGCAEGRGRRRSRAGNVDVAEQPFPVVFAARIAVASPHTAAVVPRRRAERRCERRRACSATAATTLAAAPPAGWPATRQTELGAQEGDQSGGGGGADIKRDQSGAAARRHHGSVHRLLPAVFRLFHGRRALRRLRRYAPHDYRYLDWICLTLPAAGKVTVGQALH